MNKYKTIVIDLVDNKEFQLISINDNKVVLYNKHIGTRFRSISKIKFTNNQIYEKD